MNEQPSLAEVVDRAIADYFANSEMPGIVTAFALVIERVRGDGNPGLTTVTPWDQTPARTLGLLGWAEEETRDEIRYIINAPFMASEDEE